MYIKQKHMPRKKQITDEQKIEDVEKVRGEKKSKNLLTAPQAWKTIGGNARLSEYIRKKFEGQKELDEWMAVFNKANLK